MSSLHELLSLYRKSARTEREKGTYFERLAVQFIRHDPGMAQEYEDAWLFADWATSQGLDARDTGIDAVAKIRGEETFCAIQCKFYQQGHRIQKGDIDSFFTASGKRQFSRRLIIDTTDSPWSENARLSLEGQDKPISRLGLDRLEESPIDWSAYILQDEVKLAPPKQPLPHQKDAIIAVREGLRVAERGKLIMACGTGKTFTGLKIAEDIAGPDKMVLFLVPSLALMSQSIREWTIDAGCPLRAFAVCSDAQVGTRRQSNDDTADLDVHDLDYPATTDASKVAEKVAQSIPGRMNVIFSTYQSIQVLSDAQLKHGMAAFDLIICDEAHRTTGATLAGETKSNFVKVHDQSFLKGSHRLYMTATPRVFGDAVKTKADEASAVLCSMDDESVYGATLFARGFGWAVENGLLTDYKVLVLAVDEQMVSSGVQTRLADGTSELKLDDATKIIGCYKALTKQGLQTDLLTDFAPMRRALAFCRDIATSKMIQNEFSAVVSEYLASDEGKESESDTSRLECSLKHVDGTFGAKSRTLLLDWLKEDHGEQECRILTNARCLSEGVDVPSLDAVLFMHPRKSQIDVVQSVGRVMRRAPGKKMGYVILPIGVPANITPEDALRDNDRYRVVWQILNALRSHDERFEAMINKADLGVDVSDHIEVIAVSNSLPVRNEKAQGAKAIGHGSSSHEDGDEKDTVAPLPLAQIPFAFDEVSKAIMAKIVKKCGRRDYWEDWASDIAEIAQAHIARITSLVAKAGTAERESFNVFLAEIRDDLNDSITEAEAIEMLAQHLITRPVFDALFEGHSFVQQNPVSRAIESVLSTLDRHNISKEAETLEKFYESVRRRAAGIHEAKAKQRIIVELYDKFFKKAFPKMTQRLGIVYTPIEVVDFIIHSVNGVLQSEFGQTLGSRGVHILDPFTGTGTFITRLLQSGLIRPDEVEDKYKHGIHANEIVLLAYYIAAINIEAAYHEVAGGKHVPFEGICLTDTFQLYEQDRDLFSDLMADNSTRLTRQKKLDIRVIIGNPPYSVGQESANDDAANLEYPRLDRSISSTYVAQSTRKGGKRSSYDSYIRALRWASDRIGNAGVIGFVTNAGWMETNSNDGLRRSLEKEFSNIYVLHLRGNQRTSGEESRREGGKVFGSGSRIAVAIVILVKHPQRTGSVSILFKDIGDFLTREQKLALVCELGSIQGISSRGEWSQIIPNEDGDWLKQRDDAFSQFLVLGEKSSTAASPSLFASYSNGVVTGRDSWVYNYSRSELRLKCTAMIDFYNEEVERFAAHPHDPDVPLDAQSFVRKDPTRISWGGGNWQSRLSNGQRETFDESEMGIGLYRPFSKMWHYGGQTFNHSFYSMRSIFPKGGQPNRAIMFKGNWRGSGFPALMIDALPCLQPDGGVQCFPRYIYQTRGKLPKATTQESMLSMAESSLDPARRDAITDEGLARIQAAYPSEAISKDDLFDYTYGLLHSRDYLDRFADSLSKQLPRIAPVKEAADFWAFVAAGRTLGVLHSGYEQVEPYPVIFVKGDTSLLRSSDPERFYRVEQMKFAGKRPKLDRSTVIYNSNITITNIPLEAYDYVVNGKSALEWVMERQCMSKDKTSGIINDANRFAVETVGDPAHPLLLFQRLITVSLETMAIVKSLPSLGDFS